MSVRAASRSTRQMTWLTTAFEWQSHAVMGRHVRLYVADWPIKLLPPALEPVTMLVAFGLGLGAYMSGIEWRGREVSYLTFVGPGMLAYAAFMTPFFQALFAAYIRMHYQRTWEGQLTTQIEMPHVVWGEILWAAALGTLYAAVVGIVLGGLALFGVLELDLWRLPLLVPITFLAGCAFAAVGLCFTGIIPTIDHMNLPIFLLVLPLGFASATYFPLTHPVLVAIATVNPLYHLAEGLRGLLLGGPALYHLAMLTALSFVLIVVLVPLSMRLLRRRVLGE
jgi:lipooligosaccharide transport system permease protein